MDRRVPHLPEEKNENSKYSTKKLRYKTAWRLVSL